MDILFLVDGSGDTPPVRRQSWSSGSYCRSAVWHYDNRPLTTSLLTPFQPIVHTGHGYFLKFPQVVQLIYLKRLGSLFSACNNMDVSKKRFQSIFCFTLMQKLCHFYDIILSTLHVFLTGLCFLTLPLCQVTVNICIKK